MIRMITGQSMLGYFDHVKNHTKVYGVLWFLSTSKIIFAFSEQKQRVYAKIIFNALKIKLMLTNILGKLLY